jgi:hypothetical protein
VLGGNTLGGVVMANEKIPTDVLHFVGKTGFITFELWKEYFYTAKSRSTLFHNWKELVRRKYLTAHYNERIKNTLVLLRSNKNIQLYFETKPAFIPNPTQLQHDEILLNGIMNLSRAKKICQWQTEAELKMLKPSDFKVENQSQLIKYPDAILHIQVGNRFYAIAVEYERTQKSQSRYGQIVSAYAGMKKIDAVIWIVKTPAIKNMITEQIKQVYYPLNERPMAFLTEESWKFQPEKLIELSNNILRNNE